MQAALKAQVEAKAEEKRRQQQKQLEEEQRELAKLEREREELRAQFEKEQAERRRKEKAKLDKERGVTEGRSPSNDGNVGGAAGAGGHPGANTCMTYDERVAQKAADYHRRQEERERAEANGQGTLQTEHAAPQPQHETPQPQHGRRRGSRSDLQQPTSSRGSDAIEAVPQVSALAPEAQREVEALKEMQRQLQLAQQEAADQAAQLQRQAAQLQAAQAEQARKYEQQQAEASQAQARQMEELHRQNEELRAAMSDQYNQLQEKARVLEQKRQLSASGRPASQRDREAPGSRCGSALSDSVLRTPYLDPSFQPPPKPQLPVPPPEVEAALARLRLPGAAMAAVAGQPAAVDRGWSPLVEVSAEEYRRDIGAFSPPAPHPALHGPGLEGASDGNGGTLRGASELVYPSDETLRRSIDAQDMGRDVAMAKASDRLSRRCSSRGAPAAPCCARGRRHSATIS